MRDMRAENLKDSEEQFPGGAWLTDIFDCFLLQNVWERDGCIVSTFAHGAFLARRQIGWIIRVCKVYSAAWHAPRSWALSLRGNRLRSAENMESTRAPGPRVPMLASARRVWQLTRSKSIAETRDEMARDAIGAEIVERERKLRLDPSNPDIEYKLLQTAVAQRDVKQIHRERAEAAAATTTGSGGGGSAHVNGAHPPAKRWYEQGFSPTDRTFGEGALGLGFSFDRDRPLLCGCFQRPGACAWRRAGDVIIGLGPGADAAAVQVPVSMRTNPGLTHSAAACCRFCAGQHEIDFSIWD